MKALWIVVLWGCISPVIPIGSGKSRSQVVREEATKLTPGSLRAVGDWSGTVKTVRARVWADDEYRAQHVRWQQTFQAVLDETNDMLSRQFGIKFAAEYRDWNYREPGAQLEDKLRALMNDDPGNDVLVVIGLTSSLTLVTSTFDQLGVATTPGRHLIVRGYSDLVERKVFEDAFRDLRKDEREVMYDARRRHKTASTLLHELGHAFGAGHREDAGSLMASTYSDQAVSFDAESRGLILANIDRRLGRTSSSPGTPSPPQPVEPTKPVADVPAPMPPLPPTPDDPSPILEIRIDVKGRRIIDGEVVPDVVLDGKLLLGFDRDKRTRIIIRLYPGAPKEPANEVGARARKIGFKRISISE